MMQKPLFRQILSSPQKQPNSPQAHDSAAEINLKNWRFYPSGFATLKVGIKFGASFPACAFSFAGNLHLTT
jgi:hypothetical protein